jgi:hypothetical protein
MLRLLVVSLCAAVGCGTGRTSNDASEAGADDQSAPPLEASTGAEADAGAAADASDGAPSQDAAADQADACDGRASMPAFSPPGSILRCPTQITIATVTPNATIHYTLDGSAPTASSPVYQTPIPVNYSASIAAYVAAPGLCDSEVNFDDVTIFPNPPIIFAKPSPAPGTYHRDLQVTLTAPAPGVVVCYTVNTGALPNCVSDCAPDGGAWCASGSTFDPTQPIPIDSTDSDPKTGIVYVSVSACQPEWDGSHGPPLEYTLQVDPVGIAPGSTTAIPAGGVLQGVQVTQVGPSGDRPYDFICWSTDGTTAPDCACNGATPEDAPATVGPGLYVSKGNATPVMQVQAQGASGITLRALGCAKGYLPSDSPYATATWH